MINDEIYEDIVNLRQLIHDDKEWGFSFEEKEFIKGMSLMNPQSYGPRIQNYIQKELNFSKIKANENSGDIRSNDGKNIEVKVSILTPINNALNLVQIRLFHNNDYYLCIAYDLRCISDFKKYIFLLHHDQMFDECNNATAAHGTKNVNKINKNVELRMSLNINEEDDLFRKWYKKYHMNSFEEVKNVFK